MARAICGAGETIDDEERPRDAASRADRISALQARVYGRDPDRVAVEELRGLLQVGLPDEIGTEAEGTWSAPGGQRLQTWRRRLRIIGVAATIVVAAGATAASEPVAGGCPAGWSCRFIDGLVRGVLLDPDVAVAADGWGVGAAYVVDRRSGLIRCVVAPAAGRPKDVVARADMDAVRTLCLNGPASSSDMGSIATGLSAPPG